MKKYISVYQYGDQFYCHDPEDYELLMSAGTLVQARIIRIQPGSGMVRLAHRAEARRVMAGPSSNEDFPDPTDEWLMDSADGQGGTTMSGGTGSTQFGQGTTAPTPEFTNTPAVGAPKGDMAIDKSRPGSPDINPNAPTRVMASNRIMYHVSPISARQSILQNGLNTTAPPNYPNLARKGVYLWDNAHAAWTWTSTTSYRGKSDIWAVDTTGLTLQPDSVEAAYVTTDAIPPARLTLQDAGVRKRSSRRPTDQRQAPTRVMAAVEQKRIPNAWEVQRVFQAMIPGMWFELREDNRNPERPIVHLETIRLPKELRNQGIGSGIMQSLCEWADKTGTTLTLTLQDKNKEWGTTSSGRLARFYGQFGFVRNRGQRKDYSLSMYVSMVRRPNTPPRS